MPIDPSHVRRLEWKYRVSLEQAARLGQALIPRTEPDAHGGADGAYSVLSLYYDTPDLRFYHERKDGAKVRRKLRIRNYGDELYYLEIKRKIDKEVVKERTSIHQSQVAGALNGVDPKVLMAGRPASDLRTLERFRYNMKSLGLVPAVLIGYRRQALVGKVEPYLRITFDSDLRSRMRPLEQELLAGADLRPFQEGCVLELKFDARPPRWWMDLATEFGLRRESYSKYCEGIDSWGIPRPSAADDGPRAAQGS
ncbi:MAG TPA: polyphosphate polymerase domain-containing protein [Candidatus Eisenbacteria bacterium]|nr:polyphosphate polymerase domain-containing protein [Candidatus Eisenbacteria bacterium]